MAKTEGGTQRVALPEGAAWIIAGLMLCMFVVALDGTIVSTAMPSIVGNLGGFSLYAWVPAVYLLTTAVTTPIYGKLSDLFGRKPVLFWGIGMFLLGSITSGMARSMVFLILFRALQGIGAGAVQPVTMTIIGDVFSLEQRARIQGFFSSVWGVSSVIGPLLGGFLVDSVGWRWIFYLNLPVGILATAVVAFKFHEHTSSRQHTLDIAGASYLAISLTSLLLFLIEGGQQWPWASVQSGILLAVFAVTMVLFAREEQRAPEPAVPFNLFRQRIILVSAIGAFFAGALMIGVSFEVPLFAQGVLGNDALHAGFALAPMSIGWPLAGSVAGRLAIRFGYRLTALSGMVLGVIGSLLLLTLNAQSSFAEVSIFCFLIGVGLGLSSNPMLIAVQGAVAWAQRGVATATQMFVRSFGSIVGLAIMGAIVNHVAGSVGNATNQALDLHTRGAVPPAVLRHIHDTLATGIHDAFFLVLISSALGLIVVTQLPGGSAIEHELRPETHDEVSAARNASLMEEAAVPVDPAKPGVARTSH